MKYWTVMFDRDGGESDPEGFDCREDAVSYGECMLGGGTWRWVSYEIQEGDE
jgi:hypothetical protein